MFRPRLQSNSIRQIANNERSLSRQSEDQLLDRAKQIRFEVLAGKSLRSVLPETYALVQIFAERKLGMRHYPVQLLAGTQLARNTIVEMQTGEGKTLTAVAPLTLFAFQGRGAHLATANDYLAQRDADLMRPIYQSLGLSVGVVTSDKNDDQRRHAYNCDITYGTLTEFGFDFLRDRLKVKQNHHHDRPVMRDLHYILADEADSVLLDDASTPLIIGAPGRSATREKPLRLWAVEFAPQASERKHYRYNLREKRIELTNEGREWARTKMVARLELSRFSLLELYEAMERAIQVDRDYQKDIHYVVQDGQAVIVNEHTGRLGVGRHWMDGIHQTIQAVEELDITTPDSHSARITIQSFFLSYPNRCGMTGTARTAAGEFRKIYKLKSATIPTHRPSCRKQLADRFFENAEQKWQAICDEVESISNTGRPVLLGTRSVEKSERLSKLLTERQIRHQVLNARQDHCEADLVSRAGELGCVTVATNMAGRGTDIHISDEVERLGGLHVILSELHDSPRIDRQLIGRAARQGQAGSFRRYFSLDDKVIELGLGVQEAEKARRQSGHSSGKQLVLLAQARLDRRNQSRRKTLLYHDKRRLRSLWQMGLDPLLSNVN